MQREKLSVILQDCGITVFEYFFHDDRLVVYDDTLKIIREIEDYQNYLQNHSVVHPEDRWKVLELYRGNLRGPVEVRRTDDSGGIRRVLIHISRIDTDGQEGYLLGSSRDLTDYDDRQQLLESQAQRDSLTKLYNQTTGKDLINEYLLNKNPYECCGLMVVDMDYFKNVNDNYGHLFGNVVLEQFAVLLKETFDRKDILMRAGGDEFVVFLKDISRLTLEKKVQILQKSIRQMRFTEDTYAMTCSIGVIFLPENTGGFTYEQLFENADLALYQAKERGRNRYVFCDTLRHFEVEAEKPELHPNIDARYLQNDIISSAFEIFEKNASFRSAINLLLEVVGIRFHLDRITIVRTDIQKQRTNKVYFWNAPGIPNVLEKPASFTRKDFQTLFQSHDDHGTTVLQFDHMDQFSDEANHLLMQGEAKTVVYAAMYSDGSYVGAISYVSCKEKRLWSKSQRSQLGELTKIISAHLARSQAINASNPGLMAGRENDALTGLLSFARFREEVEQTILSGHATSHVVMYTDFEQFNHFNQEYGYQSGDQLLKDFGTFVKSCLRPYEDSYVSRVAADQFVLFFQFHNLDHMLVKTKAANDEFIRIQSEKYPNARIRLRTGIYIVQKDCNSVALALDAADYARKQTINENGYIKIFDGELEQKLKLEYEISKGFDKAMKENQFKVYLQPRYSLKEHKIVGAEAMVRWIRKDGTMVYPIDFLNIYEKTGRIIDLDFFVFEQVVAFIAKNKELGRKQVPLSVNASIAHAQKENTAARYIKILEKHNVDPELLELEFTEMDTISCYTTMKILLQEMKEVHLTAAMDNFGRGYSRWDLLVDIPIKTVKLDRSLLCTCEASEKGIYFLEKLISLMKGLGNYVVCEGVETESQAKLLERLGCDEAQGFWFARPMSMEEFERFYYK